MQPQSCITHYSYESNLVKRENINANQDRIASKDTKKICCFGPTEVGFQGTDIHLQYGYVHPPSKGKQERYVAETIVTLYSPF